MRVSTHQIFQAGAERMSRQQAELQRTQEQLGTGRRLLSPSDDPSASAQMLRLSEAAAASAQHSRNQDAARASLAFGESLLGEAGGVLQDLRALLVAAGNTALGNGDRASLATELHSRAGQLLGLANARDPNGTYYFAGYQGASQPFMETVAGVQYAGDQGVRSLAVASGRSLETSVSGDFAFHCVPTGNGRVAVTAPAPNAGTATHDGGGVMDPAALTGHSYRIVFQAGPTPTYDVVDLTLGANVVTGAAYTPGQSIAFDGLQVTVSGMPSGGDRFEIRPSGARSLFDTLRGLEALLRTPANSAADRAALANGVTNGLLELDQAHERLLEARTALGSSLRELDNLGDLVLGEQIQHQDAIARLGELDYVEAAGRLASQQTALEAAQRSYLRVTSLSLFNLL